MPRSERPNMASYGVTDDPDGLLPWAWADDRLVATRNYWVTTVDARGGPHSMPVWGVWRSESETFWFSCAPDAYKARNLAANPQVVIAADDTVEVVSVEGTATVREADRAVAEEIGAKYDSEGVPAAQLTEFMMAQAMYEVTPIRAFGLIEREEEFSKRATRWVW